MIGILNNLFKKIRRRSKIECGMTLVEVILAFFIITIISVVLIQGTSVAVNTLRINKARTESIAVANEKIELIRAMDYGDIDITQDNPDWVSENPELLEADYTVTYDVSWVLGVTDSYKQLMVTVKKDSVNNSPIKAVTQIYPAAIITSVLEYPPPEFLIIEYDIGSGSNREIKLAWMAPDTGNEVESYNIYRDEVKIGSSLTEMYIDKPGSNKDFIYYVTAVYADGTESIKSNETETE